MIAPFHNHKSPLVTNKVSRYLTFQNVQQTKNRSTYLKIVYSKPLKSMLQKENCKKISIFFAKLVITNSIFLKIANALSCKISYCKSTIFQLFENLDRHVQAQREGYLSNVLVTKLQNTVFILPNTFSLQSIHFLHF